MLKIAITKPYAVDGEDAIIRHLLANGFDVVHLRKPNAEPIFCERLLSLIPDNFRKNIVTHDHFYLKNATLFFGKILNFFT